MPERGFDSECKCAQPLPDELLGGPAILLMTLGVPCLRTSYRDKA